MRKSNKVMRMLMLFALVGMFFLCAQQGRATEARMQSLVDNPMVLDVTNIVEFPGMLTVYGNSAFLTVFPAATSGNVGVLFGEDVVLGAWVHRSSRWRDLDKTDELFDMGGGADDLPPTWDITDLYMGFRNGFGMRLTLSAGLDTEDTRTEFTPPSSTDTDLYTNDGASTFSLDLMPGYSFDASRYHGDFGIGLTLNHFQVAYAGEAAYTTGWIPSFLIRHRSVIGPREEITAWVLDLTLTRRAYSAKSQGDNTEDGQFGHWFTQLVFGPRFRMPQNFTVWAGLRFVLEHLSGEVDGTQQAALTGIGAPGAILSGELVLWNMLAIRAGVDYTIYWSIAEQPDPTDDNEIASQDRGMGQAFAWATGLGLTLGDFQLDGDVRQNFYFDGPEFWGGNAAGFLFMISALYNWN